MTDHTEDGETAERREKAPAASSGVSSSEMEDKINRLRMAASDFESRSGEDAKVSDIAPGEAYADPDENFDYSGQDWSFGERVEGEIRITSDMGDLMRFRVSTPEDENAAEAIEVMKMDALNIQPAPQKVAETIVDEPAITDERWEQMTGREQKLLVDRCHQWFDTDEFLDIEAINEVLGEQSKEQLDGQSHPQAE